METLYNSLGVNLKLEGEEIKDISVAAIANGSTDLEHILEQIVLANSLNDTADLKFDKVLHPPTTEPEILTPIFIDTLILYGITTKKRINTRTKECKDVGRYNSKITELLTAYKNIPPNKIKATCSSIATGLTQEQKQ